MNGDLTLPTDYSNIDWLSTGAVAPPPSSQPSFNSPVTQDSFSILDQISTGVESVSASLSNIMGVVRNARASNTMADQAAQLAAQQRNTSTQVVRAQSTAQIQAAQANANIASAFATFTGAPLVWLVLLLLLVYFVAKRA